MKLKKFLLLKENKKAYWKGLNWAMGAVVSYLTYLIAGDVVWATTAIIPARIASEMLTRWLNKAYK